MSFVAVERSKTSGEAPRFVAGQTGNAGVGGDFRILLPFFSDRLVRSVFQHGKYFVEMPRRLISAACAHSGHGQPPKKLAAQMRWKLVDSGALRFQVRLECVTGFGTRIYTIFFRY